MDFEQRIDSLCYGAQPTAREVVKLGKALELPNKIAVLSTFTTRQGEMSNITFLPTTYASPYPWLHHHEGGGDQPRGGQVGDAVLHEAAPGGVFRRQAEAEVVERGE